MAIVGNPNDDRSSTDIEKEKDESLAGTNKE